MGGGTKAGANEWRQMIYSKYPMGHLNIILFALCLAFMGLWGEHREAGNETHGCVCAK